MLKSRNSVSGFCKGHWNLVRASEFLKPLALLASGNFQGRYAPALSYLLKSLPSPLCSVVKSTR